MKFNLLSAYNRYLCHEDTGLLVANRRVAAGWEGFYLDEGEPDRFGIRSWQARYIRAVNSGDCAGEVRPDRILLGPDEQFRRYDLEDGTTLWIDSWGRAMRAAPDGVVSVGPISDESFWRLYEAGTGPSFPEQPPHGTHPDPIVGQLRCGVDCFADDHGPRNVTGVHHGDLIGQALAFGLDHVVPALDAAAAAGYQFIRSWFNVPPHPWWADKPVPHWRPEMDRQRFREVLSAGVERGLAWHLASGGIGTLSDAEENAMFDEVALAIRDVGPSSVALFEACNEIGGTGDPDDRNPQELARLIERVRRIHPQLLYSLTAAAGAHEERNTIAEYTLPWMQHYYYHPLRDGHLWDKLRHLFSMGYEVPVRRLGWAGEPWGNGRLVSVTAFKEELDAGAMSLGAAMAAMSRQAWAHMGYGSVVLYDDGDVRGPGHAEAPALVRRLPKDLSQFRLLIHGGDRWRGTRIYGAHGDVRVDQAIHDDGRFVAVAYGPEDQRPGGLWQERDTRDVEVLIVHPMGRVLTGRLA